MFILNTPKLLYEFIIQEIIATNFLDAYHISMKMFSLG